MGEDRGTAAGALELLGVVSYGELSAFDRLAEDARLAPDLADRVEMTGMAASQYEHFTAINDRISSLGADPLTVMEPYHRPFDEFHERTQPKTWYEGLLKVYIGDGLAADFYREISELVDDDTRAVVQRVLADEVYADFVVSHVRAAIEHEPDMAGRLALWGRRLVGEAMSQAQRVATERPALTALFTGAPDESALIRLSQLTTQLVHNHTARMGRLGLSS